VRAAQAQLAADWHQATGESSRRAPPAPLPGEQVMELPITSDSSAAAALLTPAPSGAALATYSGGDPAGPRCPASTGASASAPHLPREMAARQHAPARRPDPSGWRNNVAPGPSSRLARSRPPWKLGNRGLVVLLPQGIVMGWLTLAATIQIRL
jgi:hypothetical protein